MLTYAPVMQVCLAAEAGMPYCAVALTTDYDAWQEKQQSVSLDTIAKTLADNSDMVRFHASRKGWLLHDPTVCHR